jgi:hypothetical protein
MKIKQMFFAIFLLGATSLCLAEPAAESEEGMLERLGSGAATVLIERELAKALDGSDKVAALRILAASIGLQDGPQLQRMTLELDQYNFVEIEKNATRAERRRWGQLPRLERQRIERALLALGGKPRTRGQVEALVLKLNSCHHAGLTLRSIVQLLDRGSITAERYAGAWVMGGLTDLYYEQMTRCELVYRRPKTERLIGTPCYVTGESCRPE